MLTRCLPTVNMYVKVQHNDNNFFHSVNLLCIWQCSSNTLECCFLLGTLLDKRTVAEMRLEMANELKKPISLINYAHGLYHLPIWLGIQWQCLQSGDIDGWIMVTFESQLTPTLYESYWRSARVNKPTLRYVAISLVYWCPC